MHTEAGTHTTLLGRALDWWHEVRENWQRLHELDALSETEIQRMAHDMGLSSDEFVRMAHQPAGTQLLLEKRLAGLQLDAEDIRKLSPLLLADLQKTCARCTDKGRCASDFRASPNPAGWETYCPNAGTLRTLA